ncbi:MAG: amidohydrolase family protein [Candidatus Eremiobacteraeota bacterium]|nr:amidohydrolase family protein [Candidatus Eremiobacteraeota bacterium]
MHARNPGHDGNFDCRCPHLPFSDSVFAEVELLFGRRSFLIGAAATGVAALFPWTRARAASSVTVLKATHLFDGRELRSPGVLVVKNDRIVSMNAGDAGIDATIIDLGGVTLMPGLIDCHTHVATRVVTSSYLVGIMPRYAAADNIAEAALYSIHNAQAMLRNGFTTLRDVGGGAGIDLGLRNAINNGAIIGPRILSAGPALSITGGHGDTNDLPEFVHVDETIEGGISYGPYGFRERVREHVKRHVDLIKILATGGVLSYGDTWDIPQFNLDEVYAVVDEATKFERKVAAHAHGDKGIAIAVDGGVHSVEHASGVSEKTLAKMKDRGTHLVPTIWALDSILQPGNPNKISPNGLEKAHLASQIRNEGMQRAVGSGVRFAYGTDAGVFPHGENNRDFSLLVRMGMRPIDVLRAATSNAAELLGTSDRGVLAEGKLADVIAVNGDPTRTIESVEKPSFVMLGGKRVDTSKL